MAQTQQTPGNMAYEPRNTKRAAKNIVFVITAAALLEFLLALTLSFTSQRNIEPDIFLDSRHAAIGFAGDSDMIIAIDEASADIWQSKNEVWTFQKRVGTKAFNRHPTYDKGVDVLAAFSGNGKYISILNYGLNQITIYTKDGNDWNATQTINALAKSYFSPDGRFLLLQKDITGDKWPSKDYYHADKQSMPGNISIYKNINGQWILSRTINSIYGSYCFFSQNGKYLAISGSENSSVEHTIYVFALADDKCEYIKAVSIPALKTDFHAPEMQSGAISNNGNLITAMFRYERAVYAHDATKGRWQLTSLDRNYSNNNTFNSSEQRFFAFFHGELLSIDNNFAIAPYNLKYMHSIDIFKRDGESFKYLKTYDFGDNQIEWTAFSPDGKKLAVYGEQNNGRYAIKIISLDDIANSEKEK